MVSGTHYHKIETDANSYFHCPHDIWLPVDAMSKKLRCISFFAGAGLSIEPILEMLSRDHNLGVCSAQGSWWSRSLDEEMADTESVEIEKDRLISESSIWSCRIGRHIANDVREAHPKRLGWTCEREELTPKHVIGIPNHFISLWGSFGPLVFGWRFEKSMLTFPGAACSLKRNFNVGWGRRCKTSAPRDFELKIQLRDFESELHFVPKSSIIFSKSASYKRLTQSMTYGESTKSLSSRA